MTYQIAQLVVPSDAIGNPTGIVTDWVNRHVFFITNTGLRVYDLVLETQSPITSVLASNPFSDIASSDADPVTGSLLVAGANSTVNKYDPVSLNLTGGYNPGTIIEGLVCVGCGTVASGGTVQRGYTAIKRSIFSGVVDVIFTDTLTTAGAVLNVVSGSPSNRGTLFRGASGPTAASIFAFGTNGALASVPIWCIDIVPGAETHTSSNPDITVRTVGTLAAGSIDATWTTLQLISGGYDHTDGNLLFDVSGNGATSRYLIKISSANAAVLWATPLVASNAALGQYQVTTAQAGFLPPTFVDVAATDTGAVVPSAVTGLASVGGVRSSDDVGMIFLSVNYTSGAGAPEPVAGTPGAFNGYALLGGMFTPAPPPSHLAELLDLWFAPTTAFVDLRASSERRKFIGLDGSTQFLGSDGSRPFGTVPPIFLSLRDGLSADHFADNEGAGGAFAITDGDLTDGGSAPPCGDYTVVADVLPNTPQGADPQVMLSVSDDGGRTFSLLQKWRSMGKLGEYTKRLRWLKMGAFRQRQIRLEVTDPVRRNFIGFYLDVSEGLE